MDVFQPCVTFNYLNTYQWFRERVYKLEAENHDSSDKMAAANKAMEAEKLPIGIFYKEGKGSYEDDVKALQSGPLAKQPLNRINKEDLLKEFL